MPLCTKVHSQTSLYTVVRPGCAVSVACSRDPIGAKCLLRTRCKQTDYDTHCINATTLSSMLGVNIAIKSHTYTHTHTHTHIHTHTSLLKKGGTQIGKKKQKKTKKHRPKSKALCSRLRRPSEQSKQRQRAVLEHMALAV